MATYYPAEWWQALNGPSGSPISSSGGAWLPSFPKHNDFSSILLSIIPLIHSPVHTSLGITMVDVVQNLFLLLEIIISYMRFVIITRLFHDKSNGTEFINNMLLVCAPQIQPWFSCCGYINEKISRLFLGITLIILEILPLFFKAFTSTLFLIFIVFFCEQDINKKSWSLFLCQSRTWVRKSQYPWLRELVCYVLVLQKLILNLFGQCKSAFFYTQLESKENSINPVTGVEPIFCLMSNESSWGQ